MADLIEIGVEVRTGSVKSANRELDSLGNTLKSAERSASAFVEAFERQERQVSRAAQSNRSFSNTAQTMYREILKVDQATKSASASASVFSANLDKQAAAAAKVAVEEERLRRKYVEGHAAMDLYSKELNDLAIARKADIISAEQQRQAVDRLNRQMAAGTGVFSGYGVAQQAATRSSSQMGVVVQQTGYQVGDFLVQIQSGTNPMVAFGQQATQLVGVLPLMASRLGITAAAAIGLSTALGIGIPLLTAIGAAFMRSAESAKDAAEDVTSYKDAIAGLRSELNLLQSGAQSREVLQLNKEIASVENQIYAIKNRTLDLSYADAETKKLILKSAQENSAATDEELQTLQAQLTELNMKKDAIRINTALIGSEAQEQQNLLDNQRHQNRERIEADKKAKEAQEELLKLTLQVANVPAYIPMSATARAAQEANAKMLDGLETAMRLKEQLGEGAYEALRLAGVDMTSGIDSAAKAAARLAADLNISLAAATAMSNMTSAEDLVMSQDVVKGRTADRYDVETLLGMGYTREYLLAIGKIKKDTKDAVDAIRKEIDRLNKTAAEGLTPFDKYNKALKNLDVLRTKGLSNAAYSMEIERLNDELAKSLPMVNDVADAFGDFLARGMTDFKSFANSIFKSFQNMLAQMIATAARNKILISMGATGSAAGTAASAGVSSAIGSSIGTLASGAVSVGSNLAAAGTTALGMGGAFTGSFGAGMGATMTGGLAGGASAFGTGVGMMGTAGSAMSGFAMAAGAALPVIAAVALAVSFFRSKTKELDSGLNVTIDNMDVLVESFKTVEKSKFWGLSKKVTSTLEEASSTISDPIVSAVGQIQQSVLEAAEALGFGADVFDKFSYQFKLSLKGLSEDQQMQKINEELAKMGDSFASLTGIFSTMDELLAVAQQRFELEGRLLEVQGDVVELRKRELDTVHVLNKGLAARIQLLQAEADLQGSLGAFASAISQQQGLIRSAVDALVKPLQDAIEKTKTQAEKSYSIFRAAADKTRGEAQNIVDIITGALSSRNIQSEAVELLRYRQSQQQLASFAGGASFDESSLRKATEGVSIDSTKFFGSFEDYARDFYKTQISLTKLADKAQGELTDIEKQIDIADKAYQVAMGTYAEAQDFNVALNQLLTDLAVYTETVARNQPFIDQIKAEGDRQVELLDQILVETTKQINALLGIENSMADLVGSSVSVSEALAVLGFDATALSGAVVSLEDPIGSLGSHIEELDTSLSGRLERLGLTTDDLSGSVLGLDGSVLGLGDNIISFSDYVNGLAGSTDNLGININDLGATLSNAMSGLGSIVSGLSGAISGLAASNNALASAQKSAAEAQVNAAVAQISSPLQGNVQSKMDAEAALMAAQEAFSSTSATKTETYKTGGFLGLFRKTKTRTVENPVYTQLQADIEKLLETIAKEEAVLAPAREQIKALGVTPTFATGGMHSGGMRLVGENGPELEVTGPSRIYSAQQTKSMVSGDSSETVAELRSLRQELSEFKAEQRKIGVENVKYNKKSYDLNREWDIVGLPATRTA